MTAQPVRDRHQVEVVAYLQKQVANLKWEIEMPPHGTGQESYYARGDGYSCFIKLGAQTQRYQVMAGLGLSPEIVTVGTLADGTSILVQQRILGSKPTRSDFRRYLRKFAESLRLTHHSSELRQLLPERASHSHKDAGLTVLAEIEQRWEVHKSGVPAFADYVDQKIAYLKGQVSQFDQSGLVVSHNDVCNGNWLVAVDGKLYSLDYESMSLDDPALDIGAILWWYYPPELRAEFLEIAGYQNDAYFRQRMRIRMAIHNLNIIIPRWNSFDRFSPERFDEALVDFRAVVDGMDNPQGYDD